MTTLESQKQRIADTYLALRDKMCAALEAIEVEGPGDLPSQSFQRTPWTRPDASQKDQTGGGGIMAVLRNGRIFEKGGINFSCVRGQFPAEFAQSIPGAEEDPRFWACGVSMVIHPRNPFVPAIHMNVRHIITTKRWFGGGTDMTPTFEDPNDTAYFHDTLRQTCDRYDPAYYPKFKAWCDAYFYLPHRHEPRGIGGIFFDDHNSGDFDQDFTFTQDLCQHFMDVYPTIVRRHMHKSWTPEEEAALLKKRGRYAEFNLIYDRGTLFGLKTSGNTEAILMSLPPRVIWP